jgi:hypothetical protein
MNVTLLGDIAGRLTHASANADRVTVAAVCAPTGAEGFMRKRGTRSLPKWRDATDSDVDRVINFLGSEALSIAVLSLDKKTPAWDRFWTEGIATHQRLSDQARGSIGILKPALLVKFALFGQASMLAVGHGIKIGSIVRTLARARRLEVHESHIYDKEIDGDENVEAFLDILRKRNEYQPLANSIGVYVKANTLTLATEDAESLLLFPDYIAGLAHAAASTADTLDRSSVSRSCVARSHARLKATKNYHEEVGPFDLNYFDIYPAFNPAGNAGNAP